MKVHYNPKLKEYARQLRNNCTNAEKVLWKKLKGKQIKGYDFHRQKPIGNYIADFYCFHLKLIIEVDGFTHELDKVKRNDFVKEEFFNELGFSVLRFSDESVLYDLEIVLKEIKNYVDGFQKTHPLIPSF